MESLRVVLVLPVLLCLAHHATGQYLTLNGQRFNNNSLIRMENIEEADASLECVTTFRPCCKSVLVGEWYFPDGSLVPARFAAKSFYRNRGDSGSVFLNRRNNPRQPNGRYKCVILDENGVEQSIIAGIYSTDAFPTIVTQPQSIEDAVPGTDVIISLVATNALAYNWVFNDEFNLEDSERHLGANTDTLTIVNVQEIDEGAYHCIVIRELSVGSEHVTLTVLDGPVILTQPVDFENFQTGSTVKFTIHAVGPSLSYRWEFEDGSPLPFSSDYTGVDTPTLTIQAVMVDRSYRCAVSNAAGTVFSVVVKVFPAFPTIVTQPQSIEDAVPGTDVIISLVAINTLSYNWVFNDGFYLEDSERHLGATTDTLTIVNVQEIDEGAYRCILMKQLSVESDNASLTVLDQPVIVTQPVNVKNIQLGSNVTFTLQAVGLYLSYRWEFKDGTPLPSSSDYTGVDTPTLTIQPVKVDNIGLYRCAVSNAAGTVFSVVVNNFLSGTGPISSLNAQLGVTSVNLTWNSSTTEDLLGFRVQYYHLDFSSYMTSANVTKNMYTAVGLLPHGRYRFKVQEMGSDALGPAATVDIKLVESIPAVEKLTVSTVNGTLLNAEWLPQPPLPGWTVSYYKILYRAVSTDQQLFDPDHTLTKMTQTGSNTSIIFLYDELVFGERVEHVFEVSAVIKVDMEGLEIIEGLRSVIKMQLELEQAPFQILIGPIDYCVTWSLESMYSIRRDIRSGLAKIISASCNCNFSSDYIGEGVFSCRHSPNAVTYRSTVTALNATEVIMYIDSWVQSQPASMVVRWFFVDVFSDCPIRISSLSDPECRLDNEESTPPTLVTSDQVVINCVNVCLKTGSSTGSAFQPLP